MAERDKIFRVVIKKNLTGGLPEQQWSNTYLVRADVANAQDAVFDDVVAALVSFEKDVHLENTIFQTAEVTRAYGTDGDPQNLASFVLAGNGVRAITNDDTAKVPPLETVAVLIRQGRGGRRGRVEYRNAITDTTWKNIGGIITVAPAYFDDPDASAAALIGGLTDSGTPMVLWNRTRPDEYRAVTAASFSYTIGHRDTTSRRTGSSNRATRPEVLTDIIRRARELIVDFTTRYAINLALGAAVPESAVIRPMLPAISAGLAEIVTDYPALP